MPSDFVDKMMGRSQDPNLTLDQRLQILYPMVNEEETPLPRCWSTKDKFNYIGLSQNNLRVQYKGHGKTHKDASSVRATHPIPASCGIYYFEVSIISKGRDGYMGVGLSAQGVNMNRLPGWDKQSYGYHGDDGHSFCSSGTGQAYGPTFTTGDVIGCGLNLIDGSCFYTKNGHHLGIAFTDLPPQLYPTVGLQTPGEVVDANFGQEPFMFDIEGEMFEYRGRIHRLIEDYPPPGKHGEWQLVLNRMVGSYLVHHGFCSTAEAFAKATGQDIDEEWPSIKNRQAIQKLVLAGKMGEAINLTDKLYPGFLQLQPALHFMLKVRQFVEMVSGNDDIIQEQTKSASEAAPAEAAASAESSSQQMEDSSNSNNADVLMMTNGKETNGNNKEETTPTDDDEEEDDEEDDDEDTMDVDDSNSSSSNFHHQRYSVVANPDRFDKLIGFGRRLQAMLHELETVRGIKSDANTKLLQDAFALLAYPDPWDSPVGWRLAATEREYVSSALNSTLLESRGYAARPPLEVALSHAKQLVKLQANNDLGACAFANVEDFLK